jgi:hypothetical protein
MPYTASLSASISLAHDRLKRARQDGVTEQVEFWCQRRDELLDEVLARRQANEIEQSAASKATLNPATS